MLSSFSSLSFQPVLPPWLNGQRSCMRNAVHVKPHVGQEGNPYVCTVSCGESKQAWRHLYMRLGLLEQIPFMSAQTQSCRKALSSQVDDLALYRLWGQE